MQVVLPGVMRYSEHKVFAEISFLTSSAQLSGLPAGAPAIQPGRRSRPASGSISAARIPLSLQGNPMTAITEEATEEQQRVSAETRPVSDAKVPSARDSTGKSAPIALVSGIVDLTDGRGYLRTAGYRRSATDLPLTAGQVRAYGLRKGDQIDGILAGNANANASGTGNDSGKTAASGKSNGNGSAGGS